MKSISLIAVSKMDEFICAIMVYNLLCILYIAHTLFRSLSDLYSTSSFHSTVVISLVLVMLARA